MNYLPSSNMTLSPKTLTSMEPRARSTSRIRISRIAFDLAFTSIAHTPKTTGLAFWWASKVAGKSEWDDDGDEDLVKIELERGDALSGELKNVESRDCLSQCMVGVKRKAAESLKRLWQCQGRAT